MELPCEIWEKIIVQIKDCKQCIKLFNSFPRTMQEYIRGTFDKHLGSIQTKILYSFENCVFLAIENTKFSKVILMDNDAEFQYVRVMNSGCLVSIDKNNHIIFLENHVFKKIDLENFGSDNVEEIIDIQKPPSDFCIL
jgi:hypothetical protein